MKLFIKLLLVLSIVVSQFTLLEKTQAKEAMNIQDFEMFEEVVDKRDEASKTFQTGINNYQTFQFASRVHYIDSNGVYQNIDNTLKVYNSNDINEVSGYENVANDLKIKFAKKAHSKNMISLKKDNYKIKFGISNINDDHKALIESKETSDDVINNTLSKINQKIIYQEAFEHIDIEYITTADGIKENIIIKERQSLNEFIFNFKVDDLKLILKEDGSIHAINENNEVVFTMPAPYMEDAFGNKSYEVAYELQGSNNKYTISIVADETWLSAEERAYPIIIDPYIVTEIDRSQRQFIDATYVTTDNKNKNYDDESDLCVGYDPDGETYDGLGHCRIYMRFNNLPELSTSDMLIDAQIVVNVDDISMYSRQADRIDVYDVNSNWNEKQITWNNQPALSNDAYVLDYDMITYDNFTQSKQNSIIIKTFDITQSAKKWYESGNNYGLMFKSSKEDSVTWDIACKTMFYSDSEAHSNGFIPYLVISYVNNKGLEDYFSYTSGSSGSAGNFYVDNYTGNLVVEHVDGTTVGERMPAILMHYYNASTYDKHMDSNMIVGKGWKLNIYQTIKETSGSIHEDFPYVYSDSDGTQIYFRKIVENNITKYIDDTGRGLTLEQSNGVYTITDKRNQKMIFNNGKLVKIIDSNNNYIEYQYENNRITMIWDSASHYLKLNYSGNNLISVEDMAGRKTSFTYDANNCLTKITYPDGKYSAYTYDGLLTSMWNSDSTRIQFRYSDSGIKRITKLYEESSTGEKGQLYNFDRSLYNTSKIRSAGIDGIENNGDDIISILQFDDSGRLVSSHAYKDGKDFGGSTSEYSASSSLDGSEIRTLNRVLTAGSYSKHVNNILDNHSFENGTDNTITNWNNSYATNLTMVTNTEHYLFGTKSLSLNQTNTTSGVYGAYQMLNAAHIAPNTTYTLSAYVKTTYMNTNNGGAYLRVKINDSNIYESEIIDYVTDTNINQGWRRIYVTFTTPSNITSMQILAGMKNAKATIYYDGIQLEQDSICNPYNMVENGSMNKITIKTNGTQIPSSWSRENYVDSLDVSASSQSRSASSFKFESNDSLNKRIYQSFDIRGSEKDTYVLSAWSYGKPVEYAYGAQEVSLKVKIEYEGGTHEWKEIAFNDSVNEWKYQALSFNLDNKDTVNNIPIKMTIYLCAYKQANDIYFDDIQLLKKKVAVYDYDDNGDLKSDNKTNYVYEHGDLISFTNALNETTNYEYHDHNLISATSPDGLVNQYSYDSAGNVTITSVKSKENDTKIVTSNTYDETKSFLMSSYDEDGYATTYDYTKSKNLLNSISKKMNEDVTQTTTYTYNNRDQLTSQSSNGISVNYTYNSKQLLSSITRNNTSYHFSYDNFNQVTTTKVGTTTLSTNNYDRLGNLTTTTYGNGYGKQFTYNDYGQVIALKEKNSNGNYVLILENIYDSNGTLITSIDHKANEKYIYDYDLEGRMIRSTLYDITTNDLKQSYEYGYDEIDRLETQVEKLSYKSYSKHFVYESGDKLIGIQIKENGSSEKEGIVSYGYDDFNRISQRNLKLSPTSYITSAYQYKSSDLRSGKTTTQILSEEIDGLRYVYTYDQVDNITRITRVENNQTNDIFYYYDANNQLIREDNGITGQTLAYTYDQGGNITSEKRYAYTREALTNKTANKTIVYTYGNSNWKDQLTSYDGKAITYDTIGNPTNYLGKTFGWQGRNLVAINDNISYTYNVDGIRRSKTVNGYTTTFDYASDKLVHERKETSNGNYHLYYTYDANGNLALIEVYDGINAIDKYYVAVNSRGDVERIYNSSKQIVAQYTYDSWGKIVSVENASTSESYDIGTLNSIRYRGYYYDEESGLYYVSSRYYDSEIGRWINADGYVSTGQGVLGNNMFAYCGNNPVNRVDHTGQFWSEIWEFTKTAVTEIGKAMGLMSPAYAGCGGAAVADGPLPFGDVVAVAGAALLTVGAIGYGIYQAALAPAISIPKAEEKAEAIPAPPPTPTVIYRYYSSKTENLSPRPGIDYDGLSFSTKPPRPGVSAVVTTIEQVNATGILTAIPTGGAHVTVIPTNGTVNQWMSQGQSSIWSQTLSLVVVEWDGGY